MKADKYEFCSSCINKVFDTSQCEDCDEGSNYESDCEDSVESLSYHDFVIQYKEAA